MLTADSDFSNTSWSGCYDPLILLPPGRGSCYLLSMDIAGRIILQERQERRVRSGHLWIFSNEIASAEDTEGDGGLVEILTSRRTFVGVGYYNRHSLIAARLLTNRREEIDQRFFTRRVERALSQRQAARSDFISGRVIYSEGDGLPGLIVDKYDDYLAVQILTRGMEKLSGSILAVLTERLKPKGILHRNDSPYRALEGLEPGISVASGEIPEEIQIEEHGLTYAVNLLDSQKTGFYFDQRDNRYLVRVNAAAQRVLDCFCYSGGFALNAATGGAKEVIAIDQSEAAVASAKRNAELNGLSDKVTFEQANCFDRLREIGEAKEEYDVVILDPPAFVKSRQTISQGLKGYRDINLHAMRLLPRDGILVTCSCSHHVSLDEFLKMLRTAARDSRRRFQTLHVGSQAADHPVLLAMPETQYLKCVVLRAMN